MLLASLTHSITHHVASAGLYAVFVLMLVDAVFPAASELVMVYAGALAGGAVGSGRLSLFGMRLSSHAAAFAAVAVAGTFGYLLGACIGWWIGLHAGRPFVERHPRLFHLDWRRLDRAEAWFRRYGTVGVLLGRLVPLIRSFVSIPAGIAQMAFAPYALFTLIGSAVWCITLAAIGWSVGASYTKFHHTFDRVTIGVVMIVAGVVGMRLVYTLRGRQPEPSDREAGNAERSASRR